MLLLFKRSSLRWSLRVPVGSCSYSFLFLHRSFSVGQARSSWSNYRYTHKRSETQTGAVHFASLLGLLGGVLLCSDLLVYADEGTSNANMKTATGASEWGTLGHLSEQQEECLRTFIKIAPRTQLYRAKYKVESMEQCSLRFLRARKFDVQKALQLLDDCSAVMEKEQVQHWGSMSPEKCANCDFRALKKWYPHVSVGFDKQNRPILFEHSGGINPGAVLHMTSKKHLVQYHWWVMEQELDHAFDEAARRAHLSERHGQTKLLHGHSHGHPHRPPLTYKGTTASGHDKNVNISTCVILDLSGLNLATHCSPSMLDHIKHLIALDNVCYPELLGKMFIINAPWVATSVWMMVRGWLDPRTQDKIELLGSGPKMHARLLEFISPENLPLRYGGTAVPDIYPQADHMGYAIVPANGRHSYDILVPAGKVLKIDTYTSDGAFDVSISYQDDKNADLAAVVEDNIRPKPTASSPSSTSTSTSNSSAKPPEGKVVLTYPVEKSEGQSTDPVRVVKRVHSSKEDRYHTVSWVNRCKSSARHVVFVLTIE